MAAHGSVNLAFGDGRYDFNISPIGVACELQDKCGNVGVGTIFNRLRTGTFFVNDFRETIRLALIGGGMRPPDALKLVERYVDARPDSTDTRPWSENVLLAQSVLMAAFVGVPKTEVGKKKRGVRPEKAPMTASSTAQRPTESALPLDLPPATSTP